MRFQLAKCVKPNKQTLSAKTFRVAKLCQVVNELFGRNSLSKKAKFSQVARIQISKNLSKGEILKICRNSRITLRWRLPIFINFNKITSIQS